MTEDADGRDRRIVRRAVRAGLLVWFLAAAVTVAGFAMAGGGGRTGLLAVTMGLVLGALVTTTWLLVSVLLDLSTGLQPGRQRVWWTVGAFVFSFVSPALILGAAAAG